MNNIIILTIAGFHIKINLQKVSWIFAYNYIKETIIKYYSPFITYKRVTHIDYEIVFYFNPKPDTLFFVKSKSKYIFFYKQINDNKLLCSHRIGPIQFELILRNIIQKLLKDKGFILHSSALEINDQAYVFVGPAGSGKSTIINLMRHKYQTMADDTSIIIKNGKQYVMYASPFIEPKNSITKINKQLKLGKIFFLRKSKEYKIEQINDIGYISKRLMNQTFIFFKSVNLTKNLLSNQKNAVVEFVSQFHHFYFLYFNRDVKKILQLMEFQ